MRPGLVASIIGHIGLILILVKGCAGVDATLPPASGLVVPVEIVDVALESNVRALTEDTAEEEVAVSEETPTEAEEATAPSPTPTRQRPRDDDFNLDEIAGMINRENEPTRRRTDGEQSDRTQRGAGLGTAEVAAMEDLAGSILKRHLQRCWRVPDDLPDPERLVVTLSFRVGRNGALIGQPEVVRPRNTTFDPAMAEAVRRAERAVRQCDPYEVLANDPRVGEHYEIWRDQEVTFGRRIQ